MVDLVRGVDRGYFDAGVARTARTVGGLSDAPADGQVYARQDGTWVVVSDGNEIPILPADQTPLANSSSGGVGTSAKYAREDHYHPAVAIGDVSGLQDALDNLAVSSPQNALEFFDEGSSLAVAGAVTKIDFVGDLTATLAAADKVEVSLTLPRISVRYITGTTYTVTASDVDTMLVATNGSAVTVTIPNDLGLIDGSTIHFAQQGAGQITLAGTATLRTASTLKTRAQYSVISIIRADPNEDQGEQWYCFGDLEAAA